MRNDQDPNPMAKSDGNHQPPVWKLINVIEFGDRLVLNNTFTYEKILDFLGSLSQYEDWPENLSYSYFKKLSSIIQDVILERLEEIEDLDLSFRIHKNLCYIIKIIFAKR